MLPRKKSRALCLSLAGMIAASALISSPAKAVGPIQTITNYAPPVSVNELPVTPIKRVGSLSVGTQTTTLIPAQTVSPFTLVGLTWVGGVSTGTEFKVRVRESGTWSDWFELEYGEYQGVGKDGTESVDTRVGSDPLLTGLADGVEVKMENTSGFVQSQMKVTLVNSEVTTKDRFIGKQSMRMSTTDPAIQAQSGVVTSLEAVSPQGAVVPRPRIVSRAEWGADETWREPVPRVGTTLLAGFVHHTATTNNYTAEQAPAQMRNLYAYFTQSLNYADMGYNFLVDKFGTIYEGRSGCAVGAVNCDSAAVIAQGAHTAGLNVNTFAVSAIGNYDVLAPENPAALVESIASLMAWKLAPFGLDPNATASILSTDTSGSSKFSAGEIAQTKVISAHRDVGKTACAGQYLYPYMDQIRARATDILLPSIRDVSVTPVNVNQVKQENVNISATIPAAAAWSVEVVNEESGQLVNSVSGVQEATGKIAHAWNRTDQGGNAVPAGRYLVGIKASIRAVELPTVASVVTVAAPPKIANKISFKRISPTRTKISWAPAAYPVAPVTSNKFRVSGNKGKTWSTWKSMKTPEFTTSKWRKGQVYYVEVSSANMMGESNTVLKKYVVGGYAPPKPDPVSEITFTKTGNRATTISWLRAPSDYESLGFSYRISINGKKFSAWKTTPNLQPSLVLKTYGGYKIRIEIKERNISGDSPVVTGRYVVE